MRYLISRLGARNVTANVTFQPMANPNPRASYYLQKYNQKEPRPHIVESWGRIVRDLTALVGIRRERVRDRNARQRTTPYKGGMSNRPWVDFEWDMRAEYDGNALRRDNLRRVRTQQLQDLRSGS